MRFRVQLPESTFEWESNGALFRVGRGDSCALRFEGEAAKYASWEHAEFSINDGVAYVTDLGSSNGTFVDGVRITEAKPLWTGAVVQFGAKGPRLEVLELTPATTLCGVGVPPAFPHSAVVVPPARQQAAQFRQRSLVIGLAVALLAILAFFLLRNGAAPEPNPQQIARSSDDPTAEHGDAKQPNTEPPGGNQEEPPLAPVTPPELTDETVATSIPPPPPADPWKAAKEAGLPVYRLIVVEDPQTQTAYPLAGAVIVGEQALLTTADVGVELAKILRRDWRVKAARDSQDAGVPIDRVRIHAAFQKADPEQQLYFDMALVFTSERLAGAAKQASVADLAAIERGQPLACAAINHTGEAIDRFQQLQPDWYPGKVFAVTAHSPEAAAPRLLHLRGALSDKSPGSPIFNDQGQLVAVYCEAAPEDAAAPADRAMHYAKLIEPQLIALGLAHNESPIWVAPEVPPDTPAEKESNK